MKPNLIFLLLFTVCLYFHAQAQTEDIYQTILQRVHDEQVSAVKDISELDRKVKNSLSTLNHDNGKWEEFDYTDHKRINPGWMPVLERIRTMTLAYSHPQSSYYRNKDLWYAVHKSLTYFTNHKPLPYCDNWYQQGITRPQSLSLSLINMKFGAKPLEKSVEKSTLAAICKDTSVTSNGRNNPMHKFNFGANKAQIAMGWIYMGALLRNKIVLETGVRETYAPIEYTEGEGMQYDLSYDMHYGYLYNGAYGTEFMHSVIKAASYTADTEYALKGEKLTLFREFILESIFGVIRGKWIDWNVLGRGISRIGATQRDYSSDLFRLEKIDPQGKEQYEIIRKRMTGEEDVSFGIKPQHKHYWNTDYTVHSRPSYFLSIHAVSNRNYAQEIGNQENIKGFWGASGTLNLQLDGPEYYNIFPLWKWTKLPGTTLPDTLPIPVNKAPGEGDRRGTHAFSGGVSDGLYGATAYVVDEDLHTSAKKAWFMFDEEIVCLGAGIRSSLSYPVHTILNQTFHNEEGFYICADHEVHPFSMNSNFNAGNHINWVLHNRVGYIFPNAGNVNLSVENRKSDWSEIRHTGEKNNKKVEDKNVFQLTLEHSVRPKNATYAYIMVPGIREPADMKNYLLKDNISILANDDEKQAVFHKGLHIWQIVFYKTTEPFSNDQLKLGSDIPAVIMLRKLDNSQYEISVSDPTQQHKKLNVSVKLPEKSAPIRIEFELPQKPFAGQTVSKIID
ncbi:polysaccharide lyase family 8 super-sandwich domain-containing protein [Sphingobacterium spiritivorum]|uniref:polysaccharide lyase family 8 super-sandwich domain-containing protein n=1 Tax=Sphingobacterium spiritivorum TaxID=258 RepID=UPI00191B6EFD|nr:polysaccharide lyase family 8 super-sandwich domain-containing protein [Sphingobacterium spiritivorum]QQT26120.1 chondroitin lyase [Sphingobacterium spiritivorum]